MRTSWRFRAVGLTSASIFTVPIAEQGGGATDWRRGLLAWGLLAAVSAVPWLGLLRGEHRTHAAGAGIRGSAVARTRLGWAVAIFFGLQSLQAYSIFGWFAKLYRDNGFSAHTAGLLLGVITGVTIPLSWFIPNGPEVQPGGFGSRPARANAPSISLTSSRCTRAMRAAISRTNAVLAFFAA